MLHAVLPLKKTTLVLSLIALLILGAQLVLGNSENSIEGQSAAYHLKINRIVNEHISSMIYFFDKYPSINDLDEDAYAFIVPPEPDNLNALCCALARDPVPSGCDTENYENYPSEDEAEATPFQMNVTATCLNYKLQQEYLVFRQTLDSASDFGARIEEESVRLSDLAFSEAANADFIYNQKKEASDLNQQVVGVYNQLYFSYPLHKQYELTIENLTNLQSNLKKLRSELRKYPFKFHNATSTSSS